MFCNTRPAWRCRVLLVGLMLPACDGPPQTSEPQGQKTVTPHSAEQHSTSVAIEVNQGESTTALTLTAAALTHSTSTFDASSAATSSAAPTPSLAGPKVTSSHTPRQAKSDHSAVEAKPIRSAAHQGEGFVVYLQGASPIRVGQSQVFTVVVEPQAPFKSNDKYPYRFSGLKAQAATVPTDAVTVANVTPSRTTLQVNVTGATPGAGSLEGTLGFSVCTAEKCLVERASLKVAFEVTVGN